VKSVALMVDEPAQLDRDSLRSTSNTSTPLVQLAYQPVGGQAPWGSWVFSYSQADSSATSSRSSAAGLVISTRQPEFPADCTAEVIFDTNPRWCACMPAAARLFLDARVIACQRIALGDRQIERLVQRN
jgi:hypothetical protein